MPTDTTLDIPEALIYAKRTHSLATYVDVNPVVQLGTPDLVYDSDAILSAIRNLLMCPIGARGRIFNPNFGSLLYKLLQEPFDEVTANNIDQATRQAIRTWEPRVEIVNCQTIPDESMPGYQIHLTLEILATKKVVAGVLDVPI